MKRPSLYFFVLSFVFFHCEENNVTTTVCLTPATIVDLTGLDGCGFVLELEDGKRLEPILPFRCGTPTAGTTTDDHTNPESFEWTDGKKVFIDFEEVDDVAGICMAGQIARITCIREAITTAD